MYSPLHLNQVFTTCQYYGPLASFHLTSLSLGNFIMFLKTNLGYLFQIALKNMQLLVQTLVFDIKTISGRHFGFH